jgi:hypothetical protein
MRYLPEEVFEGMEWKKKEVIGGSSVLIVDKLY